MDSVGQQPLHMLGDIGILILELDIVGMGHGVDPPDFDSFIRVGQIESPDTILGGEEEKLIPGKLKGKGFTHGFPDIESGRSGDIREIQNGQRRIS